MKALDGVHYSTTDAWPTHLDYHKIWIRASTCFLDTNLYHPFSLHFKLVNINHPLIPVLTVQNTEEPPIQNCAVRQLECDNGRCISQNFKCDGNNDCLDNTDERGCSSKSAWWPLHVYVFVVSVTGLFFCSFLFNNQLTVCLVLLHLLAVFYLWDRRCLLFVCVHYCFLHLLAKYFWNETVVNLCSRNNAN